MHRVALIRSAVLAALIAFAPLAVAAEESEAPEEGYVKTHRWHWLLSFGMNLLSNEYRDRVGTASDPLIFSDPPGIDETVRGWVRETPKSKTYLQKSVFKKSLLLGAGTILLANLGRDHAGRWIADDATALVEIWLFDQGVSRLVKDVFGRERPPLEFIDQRRGLSDAERAEEEEKDSNRRSFYSGATSRQFALMSYLDGIVAGRIESRGARVASFVGFYGLAAYTGYSRLELDRHYLTDVLAGAAAGTLIGRWFHRMHHPRAQAPSARSKRGRVNGDGGPRLRLSSLGIGPERVFVLFSLDL